MKSSLAWMSGRERSRAASRGRRCCLLPLIAATSITAVAASPAPNSAGGSNLVSPPESTSRPSNGGGDSEATGTAQKEYEQAKRALLPLGPAEIRDFRSSRDAAQAASFGGAPPQIKNREITLALAPGDQAPVIHLAPPFIAGVVFVDSGGSPWAITSVDSPPTNEGMFAVGWDAEGKVPPHNLLTVRPLTNHVAGNAVITLQGCDVPVGLVFDADSRDEHGISPREIDGLLTAKLTRLGPAAKRPSMGPAPEPALNPRLQQFLYDSPPDGAREVALDPPVGKAWTFDGHLYLRSDRLLRWPAWTGQAKAPGGAAAYELPPVPSLLVSIDGQTVTVSVEGATDLAVTSRVHDAAGS
jgi:hypothetical protein